MSLRDFIMGCVLAAVAAVMIFALPILIGWWVIENAIKEQSLRA